MKVTVSPRVWTASVDQNGRVKLVTLGTQGPPGPPGDKATQAQAEAGTDDATYMTPLRTAEAIAAAPVGTATQTAIDAEATARTNADALKVSKAGDTMTGSLLASGGAADLGDATHQWRNGYFSGTLFGSMASTASAHIKLTDAGGELNYGASRLVVAGPVDFWTGATTRAFRLQTNAVMSLVSAGVYGWAASGTNPNGPDAGLSRGAAGQVNVGNGTAGDASGTLSANVVAVAANQGLRLQGPADATRRIYSIGPDLWIANVGQLWDFCSDGGLYFPDSGAKKTALWRTADKTLALGGGTAGDHSGTLKLGLLISGPFTVATLPSASASGSGAQTTVSDCANATSAGSAVTGGGSTPKGVISNGTTWLVD